MTDADLVSAYALPSGPDTHVRANMVTTADGAATFAGRVGPLTGAADQRVLHLLRALTDVILVGAQTVRAEGYGGPLLPESWQRHRRSHGMPAQPRLAVVSGRLDLDPTAPVFSAAPRRPLVFTAANAPEGRRRAVAEVAEIVAAPDERVDLTAALTDLVGRGLPHVLCEGGPRLLAQLLAADLVDELCLAVAPSVVCGGSIRVTDGTLLTAPRPLRLVRFFEDDQFLFLTYRVTPGAAPRQR